MSIPVSMKITRGCCEWVTFIDDFIASAWRNKVPLVCVDRLKARKDWRAGMTGNEALLMQKREMEKEGEYAATQKIPRRGSE